MKTKKLWSIRCPHCKTPLEIRRIVEVHAYLFEVKNQSVELVCHYCHRPYNVYEDGRFVIQWDPKAKAEEGPQVSETYLDKKGAQVVDIAIRLSNPDGSPLSDKYSTSLVTPLRYFPRSVQQYYDIRTGYMLATIQVYAPPSHYVMPGEEKKRDGKK